MKLSSADMDAAANHLWQLLVSGKDNAESQEQMGLDEATYERVKKHMLDEKAQALHTLPTEHVYVQYILDQAQNIRELTTMISKFEETKQYNAMVGAIRLRSELHDRILTKGQECGIIHRQPDRKEIIAGVIVADLSNKQLRGTLRRELSDINGMMELHGDMPFMDVEAGPIHHGPKLKQPKQAKKRGDKKQRVVGG